MTLPGRPIATGRLHPVTQTLRDILGAFEAMGFQVVEGPEVEWDHYNFQAVNIPKDHPARDMWDTFYVARRNGMCEMLLRTHTSPIQAGDGTHAAPRRYRLAREVYRREATDPTHEWILYQVEGLAVDEGISLANMKGTLLHLPSASSARTGGSASAATTFPSWSPAPKSPSTASSAGAKTAASAKTAAGWK